MKKQKNITAKLCLLLIFFAALAMIVLPFQAWALDDSDGDGILDAEEVAVCEKYPNPTLSGYCSDGAVNTPDLYVMFLNEDPGGLPANPFEFITGGYGDVPFALHVILLTSYPLSQQIAANQNAVLLKVNPSWEDGDLGASQIAYPAYSTGPSGSVFPNRILEDVQNACGLQLNCICKTSEGSELNGVQAIFDYYLKNVIAHETFHMVGRVVPPDRKVDYHYPQVGYIMDHHMVYKEYKSSKTVQWFITDTWSPADVPRFK